MAAMIADGYEEAVRLRQRCERRDQGVDLAIVAAVCAYLLVAEDDERQAEVLQLYLNSDGHRAELVYDGRAALERVRRHPPDLMVLDVMMPGLDGLELCRIVRAKSDVPMLML